MLFIEAINRASTQSNEKKLMGRGRNRSAISNKDSVDLSSAAHQVKEIYLDGQEKIQLTASASVFANLIEHVLNHIMNSKLRLNSPEELSLDTKKWKLFLQVPPIKTEDTPRIAGYIAPEIHNQPPAKQLIFHIPVKPVYGAPIEMTVLLSPHQGSPETPKLFHTLPKENWLSVLNTSYSPDFLVQQLTDYHIALDQDGEPDQLTPLYTLADQRQFKDTPPPKEVQGLRVWRVKGNQLIPIILGDEKLGVLFLGHHKALDSRPLSNEERTQQTNQFNIKA